MPKKRITPDRPTDISQLAKRIVDIATGEAGDTSPPPASPEAVKRGEARAQKTKPEQRSATAKKAAAVRWGTTDE